MKQIIGIIAVYLILALPTIAKTVAEPETIVIDSEQGLIGCIEAVQSQYIPVALPSLTERLLQPAGSFPVDFENFDPETRKLFRGWITDRGIVKYTVGLYQDYWTDEIVALDDSGWEMFRIGREKTYDRYDLQRELFNLGKKEVLADEFTREVFLPSRISTVAELVPLVFWEAHLEVEQEELAAQQLAMQEMALAAPVETPMPAVVVNIETLDDGTVLVYLEDPPASDGSSPESYAAPAMMAMGAQSSSMLDQNPADGLSDVWVQEMAGGVIDPLDSDLDGDGMSFQAEHDLGLNPNIANPGFFRIFMSDMFNPPQPALELNDVQGVNYELDESYDLVAGNWLYIPLSLNGNTNPGPYIIVIPYSAPETFWRIRPAGFQDSADDMLNDFEEYLLGTSIYSNESDGDGLLDDWEFMQYLNPARFDTDGDGLGDGWEIGYGFDPLSTTGTNGALGNADDDDYSNLEEQLLETDPLISDSGGATGTVATIRYYYDEDDRLTDFYSGAEVVQKTILTVSHNISEEVSAK